MRRRGWRSSRICLMCQNLARAERSQTAFRSPEAGKQALGPTELRPPARQASAARVRGAIIELRAKRRNYVGETRRIRSRLPLTAAKCSP
ncbi:hypothetical protein ABBQ38_008525 [Trebouxia sp. C0009 RCD-2024]